MKKKVSTTHGTLILAAVAIIAAVAVILGVALGATSVSAPTQMGQSASSGSMTNAADAPVYANPGELAQGFPSQFILDLTANIVQSYALSYPSGSQEYATTFSSAEAPQTLFSLYKTYFTDNGWSVITAAPSGMEGIYAQKGSQEVSVAVSNGGPSTQVVIGYVTQ